MIQVVLPWLPALACSLMMLFCVRGMFGKSCDKSAQPATETLAAAGSVGGPSSLEEEIAVLRARLAALESQNVEKV